MKLTLKDTLCTYSYLVIPALFLLSAILFDVLTFLIMGISFPAYYSFSIVALLCICAFLIFIKNKWTQFAIAALILTFTYITSVTNIICYKSLSEIVSFEHLQQVGFAGTSLGSLSQSYYRFFAAPAPILILFISFSITALLKIRAAKVCPSPPYRANIAAALTTVAVVCYIAGFSFFALPKLSNNAQDAYTNNTNVRYNYETFTNRIEVMKNFGTYSYYWNNLSYLLGWRNSNFVYNVPETVNNSFTFAPLEGGKENVIMMLMESIERRAINEITMPNFSAFIKNTVEVKGYHSMNRTYTTEYASLTGIGLNQLEMNSFPDTLVPFALPYILKNSADRRYENVTGFHNNYRDYYNRSTMFPNLGFKEYISLEDMPSLDPFTNWGRLFPENSDYKMMRDVLGYDEETQTYNPDNKMAPANGEKFFSYMANITTHAPYYDLNLGTIYPEAAAIVDDPENITALAKLYANFAHITTEISKTNESAEDPAAEGTETKIVFKSPADAAALRNYMIACYEYDRAIGLLLDYLNEYDLLETTTIVFYGDHYNYLNPDLCNPPEKPDEHAPQGSASPFFIHSPAFKNTEYKDGGTIKKFMVNYDIYATVTDLLHIKTSTKYNLGISVFKPQTNTGYNVKTSQIFTEKFLAPFDLKTLEPGSTVPSAQELDNARTRLSYILAVMHNIRTHYVNNTIKEDPAAFFT